MRLIDADVLLYLIKDASKDSGFYRPLYDGFEETVNRCPTIEAEPVRHGRWEDRGGLLTPMHRYDEFTNPDSVFYGTCSVCGRTVYQGGILNGFKYCPHCGAKMDLKPPEETEKGESPC